jgi:hypothetical protein
VQTRPENFTDQKLPSWLGYVWQHMNLSFRVRTVTKPLSWNMYLRPSCTSWCARHTRSRLLMWLNYGEKRRKTNCQINMTFVYSEWDMFLWEVRFITSEVTLDPKSQPAPRGLTAHVSISSGSLHMRSQNGPSCGISQFRSITLICHVIGKKNVSVQTMRKKSSRKL